MKVKILKDDVNYLSFLTELLNVVKNNGTVEDVYTNLKNAGKTSCLFHQTHIEDMLEMAINAHEIKICDGKIFESRGYGNLLKRYDVLTKTISKNNSSESEVEKERNRILKEMERKWPYKITQESNGSRYDFIFMKDMQRIILNIGEDGEPLDHQEIYSELRSHEI